MQYESESIDFAMSTGTTAKQRYNALVGDRDPYLQRARRCAQLTIPAIMPEDTFTKSSKIKTPYQSVGAAGVNNLASKLLLSLLPVNQPFFRLAMDDKTMLELTQDPAARSAIEQGLSVYERNVMYEVDSKALRPSTSEAMKHLVVAGNVLLYKEPGGSMKMYRIDKYVVKRDGMGNVIEILCVECVHSAALPEEIRELVRAKNQLKDKEVEIYTHVQRDGKYFSVYQEVEGIKVKGSEGKYLIDECPFMALRFITVDGEDYGRSYVEEYLGDLIALEGLSKALLEGSAAAAKMLILVNPNGTTNARTIAEAPNGAIRTGNAADVGVVQTGKFADFQVARGVMQDIEQRLGRAFLMYSAVQRNAERVTAEEIRTVASELESAIGGIYSTLAVEFQLPLVAILIADLVKQNKLPKLPKGSVRPTISTGLEALGRGNDLTKLDMFIAGIGQTFGPQAVAQYINVSDYLRRRAASLGIQTEGLVKSEEEIQAEMQAAQQQQVGTEMMKTLGPQAMEMASQAMVPVEAEG